MDERITARKTAKGEKEEIHLERIKFSNGIPR